MINEIPQGDEDRRAEAKWLSDKATLETGQNFVFVKESPDKDAACKVLNINYTSYQRFRDEKDGIETPAEEKKRFDNLYKQQQIKSEFIELISGKEKKWGEASELLTKYILGEMKMYTTKDDVKTETWIYKDGIYVPQGKSEVKEFLRKLLGSFYSAYIYNLVITKIEPDTFIDIDEFFSKSYPGEVAVKNGILNLNTLEVHDFTQDKIFFNKMPVNFDLSYLCPKIDEFLSQILSTPQDRLIFYEILGFALMDEYKLEKAFMFHGSGRNGKGKAIELMKKLFGPENCAAVQLSSLTPESFSVSELFGKRMNLAGDIGSQDLKETNMFKSLTGRDLVSAKRKFLRNLNFQNNSKFVFACNELPMVFDMSKGFWDRWILLDFPYTFITKEEYDKTPDKTNLKIRDNDILSKISTPEELSGLLNQAIAGLRRLLEAGKFSTTESSDEVKQRWIRRSNSFIAFCLDCIEDDYEGRISKKQLRKKYSEYCKAHKITSKSDFVIKKVLQETYGASEVRGGYGLGEFNVRNDLWEGIRWKDESWNKA